MLVSNFTRRRRLSAVPRPAPASTATYVGCFRSASATAVAAMPWLLSTSVASLGECEALAQQAGYEAFTVADFGSCWAGAAAPGPPFYRLSDDAACSFSCKDPWGPAVPGGVPPGPECGGPGYHAVFSTAASLPAAEEDGTNEVGRRPGGSGRLWGRGWRSGRQESWEGGCSHLWVPLQYVSVVVTTETICVNDL